MTTETSDNEETIVDLGKDSLPSIWQTLGRLFHESVYIVFFVGLHWLIKWWLTKTHQDQEWWARYLLNVSIVFAVVAFTVVFGCELILDCRQIIRVLLKAFRRKANG
jgi:hypothetical protein